KDSGKLPFLTIFHELLIVTGTIRAEGANFISIFKPLSRNGFKRPFRLLVPSGKITAERLCFSIYCASFLISGKACRGSFRSIKTEPPFCKLYETLGIPFPSSILEINFG